MARIRGLSTAGSLMRFAHDREIRIYPQVQSEAIRQDAEVKVDALSQRPFAGSARRTSDLCGPLCASR